MGHRVTVRVKMTDIVDQKVLKWFGHAEGTHGKRITIKEHESEVERRSGIVRTCTGLLGGVEKASDAR